MQLYRDDDVVRVPGPREVACPECGHPIHWRSWICPDCSAWLAGKRLRRRVARTRAAGWLAMLAMALRGTQE